MCLYMQTWVKIKCLVSKLIRVKKRPVASTISSFYSYLKQLLNVGLSVAAPNLYNSLPDHVKIEKQ